MPFRLNVLFTLFYCIFQWIKWRRTCNIEYVGPKGWGQSKREAGPGGGARGFWSGMPGWRETLLPDPVLNTNGRSDLLCIVLCVRACSAVVCQPPPPLGREKPRLCIVWQCCSSCTSQPQMSLPCFYDWLSPVALLLLSTRVRCHSEEIATFDKFGAKKVSSGETHYHLLLAFTRRVLWDQRGRAQVRKFPINPQNLSDRQCLPLLCCHGYDKTTFTHQFHCLGILHIRNTVKQDGNVQ